MAPNIHNIRRDLPLDIPDLEWTIPNNQSSSNPHNHEGYFAGGSSDDDMVDIENMNDNHIEQEDEDSDDSEGDHHQHIRTTIRKLSSLIDDPDEHNINRRMLKNILADVGRNGYEIQGISVWVVDEETDKLEPRLGGWWHDDTMPKSEALCRLVDSKHKNHVPCSPVAPGVDIAGLLWLESNKSGTIEATMAKRVSSIGRLNASFVSLAGLAETSSSNPLTKMIWRDLKSLVQDPDTAKGPRLTLLEQAGFGQATGIPFETDICKGLVVFFCESQLDEELLNGVPNTTYLRQSAQFTGCCISMADARQASVGQRIQNQKSSISDKASSLREKEGVLPSKMEQRPEEAPKVEIEQKKQCLPHRLRVWANKTKGGGMQIPPALSVRQSLWTAFGAFCGLLVLSSLNEYYKYLSDDEFFLLIGPFGALMTLQYGLTAAPASQPRNAIMGQVVSGAVSLTFTYIPESVLSVWLRRAIGPALGIATMVKLGFTHPPAGAHAVLYASGKYDWTFYSLVVLSTVISVIPATLVNNLSTKRQYPTYWGFVWPKWAKNLFSQKWRKDDSGDIHDG